MKILHELLHRAPAWIFLIVPFLAFMFIAYTVSVSIPTTMANHYLFLLTIFIVVSISRTVQLWEYGIELYDFLLFWFAFTYGAAAGTGMVILSFLFVTYFVLYVPKHYLIHTMLGPILTTVTLIPLVIIAGMAGRFFPGIVTANPVIFPLIVCTTFDMLQKFGANRFAGVEIGRLASAQVVEIMINYNLFLFYTPIYLGLLVTV